MEELREEELILQLCSSGIVEKITLTFWMTLLWPSRSSSGAERSYDYWSFGFR